MADTKVLQSVVSENIIKRIQLQPEKKDQQLSDSKIAAILLKEALDAREVKKSNKK
jgi:hypothetical protein